MKLEGLEREHAGDTEFQQMLSARMAASLSDAPRTRTLAAATSDAESQRQSSALERVLSGDIALPGMDLSGSYCCEFRPDVFFRCALTNSVPTPTKTAPAR